jgi:hypothetical protein
MTATRYYKESLMKGRKDEFPDLWYSQND